MKNKLEYRIEDGSLIIDNYFNNLKISSINCGGVESILGKCKLFDEEYVTLLKENKQLKERIEYLERSNDRREDTILGQRQEIGDLEDNWNKLKEWLEKELGDRINPNNDKWLTGLYDAYRETIDKMQEIEGSDSDESRFNIEK